MVDKISKLFKKTHPIKGHAYAVTTGAYVGEILVYVEGEDVHSFISLPKNINREVPRDKFELGMSEGIVEEVEKIPSKIFKLLEKQHAFNLKRNK